MELKQLRDKLDKIDEEIVLLLAKRLTLIPAVAEYKKKNNVARHQPDREKQIIDSRRKIAEQNKINPDLVEKIFKDIILESHEIEKKVMGK
ncbi:chorismate mutase [Candidatus Pacearchaeota archaeon]|nr:chorismate mutase [Candidatus Pacearchaeota archaeon]